MLVDTETIPFLSDHLLLLLSTYLAWAFGVNTLFSLLLSYNKIRINEKVQKCLFVADVLFVYIIILALYISEVLVGNPEPSFYEVINPLYNVIILFSFVFLGLSSVLGLYRKLFLGKVLVR